MIFNTVIFIIAMFAPFLFFRGVLGFLSKSRDLSREYVREGKKFHHLHFGLGILLVGLLGFMILGVETYIIIISGLGFGMIMDDFIPSLYLPEPEPQTSKLYLNSFRSTLLLFVGIGVVLLAAAYLVRLCTQGV